MRYCPRLSETVLRTPINAGLVASTVTPGNTAPCASRIVPAIVPSWANAVVGIISRHAANRAYLALLDCSIEVSLAMTDPPLGTRAPRIRLPRHLCQSAWLEAMRLICAA